MAPQEIIEQALRRIQARWYAARPREFWRDRRALLEALTWPAAQLRERGVPIRREQYQAMLDGLLSGIETHGEAARTAGYFPGYLKRCVTSHWRHHWEDYYEAGKRLRNTLDRLVARAARHGPDREEDHTAEILAAAHDLVRRRPRPGRPDKAPGTGRQLGLF